MRKPWAPRSGSVANRRMLTASMIDSCDFINERRRAEREVLIPAGPKIAFTAGLDHNDHRLIWQVLDKVSPASLTREIVKAAADARAEDRAILQQYQDTVSRSIGKLDGLIKRAQVTDQQRRRLIWTGVGGIFVGIMLWSILPGTIARSLPASWHVPEWMAARTMGKNPREAGTRLIAMEQEKHTSDRDTVHTIETTRN